MKETCRFFTTLTMATMLAFSVCPATAETAETNSTNIWAQAIQQLLASSRSSGQSDQSIVREESKDFLGKLEEDGFLSSDTVLKIRTFLESCVSEPQAEVSVADADNDNPVLHKILELTQSGKLDEETQSSIEAVISAQGADNQPMNGQLTSSRLKEMQDSGILNQEEVETIVFQMLQTLIDTALKDQSITQTMHDSIMDLWAVG